MITECAAIARCLLASKRMPTFVRLCKLMAVYVHMMGSSHVLTWRSMSAVIETSYCELSGRVNVAIADVHRSAAWKTS